MSKPQPNMSLASIAAQVDTANVYDLARDTALQEISAGVWIKREDQQDVFSFKIRGAANRMSKMSKDELSRGVVAASAGNHAQGVASAAAHYGCDALIFMPVTTPPIKVEAVKARGGKVKLIGDSYDEACAAAITHAQTHGAVFIHPFDEADVIAGQGTIGKEITATLKDIEEIYIGVGGGGQLSGIGAYVRTHYPDIKIIAVEPTGASTLKTSIDAGKPTALTKVDAFADGVAVKMIGENTLSLINQIQPDIELVSNDEICAAVKIIFEKTRTVVEPAGALALAGLKKRQARGIAGNGHKVAIVSGANVNFDRIGYMVERAELGAGGEIMFCATLPEKPGSFLKFCEALGNCAVSEFNYRYADNQTAHVLVGVKIKTAQQGINLMAAVEEQGMDVIDLTDNRLAKEHLRHMVGGRGTPDIEERIYSFEFPERPGALRDFLTALDGRWNISMFHYRNHGAASGQVLCGFQIPYDDEDELIDSLKKTGYPYQCESDNPAYKNFLKA